MLLEVEKRKDIVSKAKDNSYKCIRREREHFDQIFITDKSGNIFEVKNVDKNFNSCKNYLDIKKSGLLFTF